MLSFRLRPATMADMKSYLDLANDPFVRKNSVNSSTITIEEHEKWYTAKLNTANSLLLVMEIHEAFAGQIRFDVDEETAWIDYSIRPEYRGQGLGAALLQKGIAEIPKLFRKTVQIAGKVKKDNLPSAKAFLKAGFHEVENLTDTDASNLRLFCKTIPLRNLV